MTLGILLPTRGRPQNLERFLTAVEKTATGKVHVLIRLDTDDPMAPKYDEVLGEHKNIPISVMHGDRVGFGASLNELAEYADTLGISHVGMFGDDVEPRFKGWDEALVEALNDRLGVAYGNDGLRGKHAPDLPTHFVTQTEVYRRLGYLAPPSIYHLFVDNVARDVGRFLKNFVYVPVHIAHLHPWAEGEHLNDATYSEGGRNAEIRRRDLDAYQKWSRKTDWKKRLRG